MQPLPRRAAGCGRRRSPRSLRGPSTRCPSMPIGVVTRARSASSCPTSTSCARNRAHFDREPISPIEPRPDVSQGRLDDREVFDVVVRHDEHVRAVGQVGERRLGHRQRGARAPSRPRRRARRSSPARRPLGREHLGARVDEVQLDLLPARGCGRAPARRGRGRRSRPTARPARVPSSMVTSPPQHCTPYSVVALSLSVSVSSSGSAAPAASISRARSIAVASRLPPPTVPKSASAETTIFAPPLRGACPRTIARVTITRGRARRAQALHARRPSPRRRPAQASA